MTRAMGDRQTITDAEVRAGTGRDWAEWRSLLDEWGAADMSLTQIVGYLVEHDHLELLWAQVMAVYYRRYV